MRPQVEAILSEIQLTGNMEVAVFSSRPSTPRPQASHSDGWRRRPSWGSLHPQRPQQPRRTRGAPCAATPQSTPCRNSDHACVSMRCAENSRSRPAARERGMTQGKGVSWYPGIPVSPTPGFSLSRSWPSGASYAVIGCFRSQRQVERSRLHDSREHSLLLLHVA